MSRKVDKKIELRAFEIWAEHECEGRSISMLKAMSQAVREHREQQQRTRKVRLF
jgi:hypothetical protein